MSYNLSPSVCCCCCRLDHEANRTEEEEGWGEDLVEVVFVLIRRQRQRCGGAQPGEEGEGGLGGGGGGGGEKEAGGSTGSRGSCTAGHRQRQRVLLRPGDGRPSTRRSTQEVCFVFFKTDFAPFKILKLFCLFQSVPLNTKRLSRSVFLTLSKNFDH
jgi:hypothetical protein